MISQFELVKLMLGKCQKEEIKSFKSYLKTYDSGSGNYRNKSVKLLDLLLRRKNINEEVACKKLYFGNDRYSTQSFKRLVHRFKDKLFECLSLDINLFRKGVYTDTQQYRIEVYKSLLYSEISRVKGTEFDTMSKYKRIILIAKKYELYSELSQILFVYYAFLRFKSGKAKLSSLHNQVLYYDNCNKALFNAGELVNKLLIDTQYSASGYKYVEHIEDAIEKVEQDYKIYNSGSILHYLLLLKMELMHKRRDYENAERISYDQIELYKKHPAVKMPNRLGAAYLNLGNNLLYQFKYSEASSSLVSAYNLFSKNRGNYNIAKEIEVYVKFYYGELDSAQNLLNDILSLGVVANSSIQISKRSFLLANILFLKKQHKGAHKLLQETKEIDKDKEGWNLGIRILTIINQLEMENLDVVDHSIESMRKHIDRTLKMKTVRKRDVVILRLLAKLSRQGFNFKEVWKKNLKYFEMLASEDPDYRWEMKSPEMIIFHKWFEAKAMGKPYDYVLSSPESLKLKTKG